MLFLLISGQLGFFLFALTYLLIALASQNIKQKKYRTRTSKRSLRWTLMSGQRRWREDIQEKVKCSLHMYYHWRRKIYRVRTNEPVPSPSSQNKNILGTVAWWWHSVMMTLHMLFLLYMIAPPSSGVCVTYVNVQIKFPLSHMWRITVTLAYQADPPSLLHTFLLLMAHGLSSQGARRLRHCIERAQFGWRWSKISEGNAKLCSRILKFVQNNFLRPI